MKQSRIYLLIGLTWISVTAKAGMPLWTFQPLTGTVITVPAGSTATIEYQVTNRTSKLIKLQMRPIKGITASGCTAVVARQNCTLTLQVNGSNLQQSVIGGPVLCNQGNINQCYFPSDNDRLHITKLEAPLWTPVMIGAGSYIDVHGDSRPMIAVSQNYGTTWSYPSSVNTPIFTPDNTNAFSQIDYIYYASCAEGTCIAMGGYIDINLQNHPILAVSQDSGTTWTYPSAINAPVFTPDNTNAFDSSSFPGGVSCSGATCVAVSVYYDINGDQRPMGAVSQDRGATWIFPSSINALVFTPGIVPPVSSGLWINTVNCNGATCIIGGQYNDSSIVMHPLLGVSQDNGITWVYPSSANAPVFTPNNANAYLDNGYFAAASCSDAICIATGSYSSSDWKQRPLLALSQDHGGTWSFPSSINAPVFTPNNANAFVSQGTFNSASCSGTLCIAVGQYLGVGGINRPLIAVSQDSGVTWSYPSSANAPIFTPDNANAFTGNFTFFSASCSGTTCVAVGNYLDNSAVQRPFLALSQDSGVTWSYPSSVNAPIFTPDNTNAFAGSGNLNSVSCSNTNCIATGQYLDNNGIFRPLIVISQDNGTTWSFPSGTNAPTFTPDNSNAFQSNGNLEGASIG